VKDSLNELLDDTIASLRNLLPILLVIGIFQVFVFQQPMSNLASLVFGALLVVLGLACFIFGLKIALFPVGENLAHALAKKGSVFWLVAFAFVLGFGTTIAEPALIAVAEEAAAVAAGAGTIDSDADAISRYALGLRLTVALSVGIALILGVVRILTNWSLPLMIISGYIIVIVITTIAPKDIVGIAYDSGGVTTSTITVPLVAALGVGLASSLRGRNPMTDGFGLIAFASLTPILFVLVFGLVVQWA
jgi:hypothetical protein